MEDVRYCYSALIEDAKIAAQDSVVILVHRAAWPSCNAIANSVGARSIALNRTSAKLNQLTDAGARYVIVMEEEDLVNAIDEITARQGARVVFDPVGGPTLSKLIEMLSFQGILYIYGALSDKAIPPLNLIAKVLTIKGHNIWLTSRDPVRQKAALEFVIDGLEKMLTDELANLVLDNLLDTAQNRLLLSK